MKRGRALAPAHRGRSHAESILWLLLQATVVTVPLLYSHGHDVYRMPKLLLLQAAGMILFAGCIAVALVVPGTGFLQRLRRRRAPLCLVIAATAWTGLTTLTSTQRAVSLDTLTWVTCCAAFFLVSVVLSEHAAIDSIAIALVPALINSAVAMLQRFTAWNPFVFAKEAGLRQRVTGFVGNPNDLAGYLVLACLAAAVLAVVRGGFARFLYAFAALFIMAGVAVTETVTAVLAVCAAVLVLVLVLPRRRGLSIALVTSVVIALAALSQLTVLVRVREKVADALAGNFIQATSGRSQAFAAAWRMFVEHPLVGVGPGCFQYWYLPYNVQLTGEHPEFLLETGKFGDVHNDALQLLATTGVPGCVLLALALWQIGRASFGPVADERQRFARRFAAPAATAIAIIALGQFALELAAPTLSFLYFGAVVVAWGQSS
jgi:O-antigen ligase